MPTWAEIQEYARTKYKLAEDNPDSFKLVFEYQNRRLQAVIVSRFEAMQREWVDFASACCRRDQMDPEVALERNFSFAVGALALDTLDENPDHKIYVVRYSVLLATMDMDEFELPLHVVASTADKLEQEFARNDEF